ncbi:lipase member K [Folsomia candida]|uniref:lipase member K n=1 Tax=Folsomia candida TaxID=158441 RepID=UPI000B8F3598|nr:lipase member K [Folsomia candida]
MSYNNNNNAEKSRQTVQTCCSDEENSFMLDDHEVITEDGYILKLQRLVKREEKISPEDAKKPAVLLVHGLTCHGDNWCLPHVSLSYLLVEQGFDCWIPTLRGSSMKHVSLSVKSKKFWDFSFHEMGVYDLPAIINYVLDLTGNANLSYVGHSMGFTVLFALLSTNPEFCSKVNVCVGLAPAHYGEYIRGLVFKISLGLGSCVGASSYIRRHPITNRTTHKHIRYVVPKSKQIGFLSGCCMHPSGEVKSQNSTQHIEKEIYWKRSANKTSIKVVCHGLQCFSAGQLQMYDYGRSTNRKVYGQPTPPKYEAVHISTPVATFSSTGDLSCTPQDVARLSGELPNLISHIVIQDKSFSHSDFVFGENARVQVFQDVILILLKYNKNIK